VLKNLQPDFTMAQTSVYVFEHTAAYVPMYTQCY